MGPINGINLERVKYFSLQEYVARIKLEKELLEHLEETNNVFDEYLKKLLKYDDYSILYYWIDSLSKEIKSSQQIEGNHIISPGVFAANNLFFDSLQMSNAHIKRLNGFALQEQEMAQYRKNEARVSYINHNNQEIIYWYGAEAEDIQRFMNDFIEIYKQKNLTLLHSNPFLKSALMFLLFIRIHPFADGNGRTGRMIQNIKFTDLINRMYGMRLKISPLNLSESILINQITYVKRLDSIYFDLEHDCNDEINAWFNFILDMADEQLYYHTNRLPFLDYSFRQLSSYREGEDELIIRNLEKMKIK